MDHKCTKVKFAIQQYADYHIKKHKLQNDIQGLEARSYKCLLCQNSWHISSKLDSQKLADDNCELIKNFEEEKIKTKKLQKEINMLTHSLSQKGRNELKEEVVIAALERILVTKTEQIRDLSSRNKQLTETRDYLLCKNNEIKTV